MSDADLKAEGLELISCDELAQLLRSGATQKVLIVDCRSFLEFNTGNIVNSVNVCCSKLVKRRLQQNKVPISEFLSSTCHVDAERDYEIILCDQCSSVPDALADDNLVVILSRRCRDAFRRVRLLVGGFLEFQATHPSLCETKSVLTQASVAGAVAGHGSGSGATAGDSRAGTPLSSGMTSSLSQPCLPVANVGPTKILPYLFLGSQQDAMSAEQAQINGITYVLNVSLNCPKPPYIQDGHFLRIPVNDNYSEKLLPYFHEAFQFLDKVREGGSRVLVHCLAGISRSPTLAIAYIMRCYHMTSDEAYRYVKDKRPTISPNFNFLGQLLEYERQIEAESAPPGGGGGGHKRRCLDDLRSVGALTPTPASAASCSSAGSSSAPSSPACSPCTAPTPLAVVATPMPSGPTSWLFPPSKQRQLAFAGDGGEDSSAARSALVLPEACGLSGFRSAVGGLGTTQQQPQLPLSAVAALQLPSARTAPSVFASCGTSSGGSATGSPRQLSAPTPELTSVQSQQSPSSALANLRFECSLPAVLLPDGGTPPLLLPPPQQQQFPPAERSRAAARADCSAATTLRIGLFPTVSLSDLSFTPCLVAPAACSAAVSGARSAAAASWSRGSTPSREETNGEQGQQATGQGHYMASCTTASGGTWPGCTSLESCATVDQAKGAVGGGGGEAPLPGSLGRSRRQGMSLNLTPSVAAAAAASPAFASSSSLSSSAPQLLLLPPPSSAQPPLAQAEPSACRGSAVPAGSWAAARGQPRAVSADPDLCGHPSSAAAVADVSGATGEPVRNAPPTAAAGSLPPCGGSAQQEAPPRAQHPPLRAGGRLPLQRPTSISLPSCAAPGWGCSWGSGGGATAMDFEDAEARQSSPSLLIGRSRRPDVDSSATAAAATAATSAGSTSGTTVSVATAVATALTLPLGSRVGRSSDFDAGSAGTDRRAAIAAAAAAAAGKMPSARTVPADLNSVLTTAGEGRLWAGALSEMSPHRKSRSLEDILLKTAPRSDWDSAPVAAAAVGAGGGTGFGGLTSESVAAAAAAPGATCRCLRRRSAVLVFSGGEDGVATNVSVVTSPQDRCLCCGTTTGAAAAAATAFGGVLPRPSSGSVASTSSSGGSRTASLHSSLEMIQVS